MRENRKLQLQNIHMNIAYEYAKMSEDPDYKVGCIIVKNNNIIGIGYNGTLRNDKKQIISGASKDHVVHAEINALSKILFNGSQSIKDAELYCTLLPCFNCCKSIYQAGIKTIFYSELHKDKKGYELLISLGIKFKRI